jgi:hypothetical protein
VLRIFQPKRDKVTVGWRKLRNEVLRDLYSSLSIISMIKSKRMRGAEHVSRMGEKNAYVISRKAVRKEAIRKTKAWVCG